jgi:hypothetical protein
MVECPACAGPAEIRVDCYTCKGKTLVAQEIYDSFMIAKSKQDALNEFYSKLFEYPLEINGSYTFVFNDTVYGYSDGVFSETKQELPENL